MKFSERKQEEAGIDLTPFIDVVFMLLLFFVVSTSLFKGATQLDVQLPKADVQALTKEGNTLEIGVDAKGEYYLNGNPLGNEPKKLKRVLASKLEQNKSLAIVVAGDKKAPHQAVVSVLEVASQLGVNKVQIIAQK
ncbi:MAG: biopolymer transporter ExbD [Proteobacteria bacterium]|nr:biopolymer transporter ExbD [Pseudomonadota bacterium]